MIIPSVSRVYPGAGVGNLPGCASIDPCRPASTRKPGWHSTDGPGMRGPGILQRYAEALPPPRGGQNPRGPGSRVVRTGAKSGVKSAA